MKLVINGIIELDTAIVAAVETATDESKLDTVRFLQNDIADATGEGLIKWDYLRVAFETENTTLFSSTKEGTEWNCKLSEPKDRTVTIPLKAYEALMADSLQLTHLEENGVDNWSEYSRYSAEEEDEQ